MPRGSNDANADKQKPTTRRFLAAVRGIRVNAVAPGLVWTPLNPSDDGMTPQKVAQFGADNPMARPAQPEELAPAYEFSPPTPTRRTSPARCSR